MTHTGFRYIKMPGHIYGAYHTEFLLENKNGLQIVLSGRMKFHWDLPSLLGQAPTGSVFSDIDKVLINTGLLQKFLMGAMLCDLAVANYQDLIGVLYGI